MGQEFPGFLGGLGVGQMLRRWQRALRRPEALPSEDLDRMGREMTGLRDRLDQMAAQARSELMARSAQTSRHPRPDQCDWSYRPAPWRDRMRPHGIVGLGSPTDLPGDVRLFHDATRAQMSLRQDPAPTWGGGAPFGLVLEVYDMDGSFVSFVQDLPASALDGMTRSHFIAVHLMAEREQPVEVYARLNVQHGPNTEQMVRQVEFNGAHGRAEFDLAYAEINEKRLEKAWLDLIVEGPEMTRIALWDMEILRAPRADI